MDFSNKTVVITGGASGIGAALAQAVQAKGARVAIADRSAQAVDQAAEQIGCLGVVCDVTREAAIQSCIRQVEAAYGPIDVFVSNAGVFQGQPDHAASAPDAVWMLNWQLHVMAHVYAARALLPGMLARGAGYFVNVASAAGLLNQIGDAAYSASKHAAVSFAESLAITHGAAGIGVSVVCPQYVATPLIGLERDLSRGSDMLLTADEVAESIIAGAEMGAFLILPHPDVAGHARRRAADHGRWLKGMQRLQAHALDKLGPDSIAHLYRLE
ncbi:dehydrogenase [Roseobacter cerasinus]|uniref:Dehydrogenase n=1 Tax=Roseobacter cerasinus TaxID=2602289 RepID=A0A640VLL9_9RHOB|nr:SDR family oxidoreductase [Roseobacter cerasinus]GFE49338.1 dehydrogenase [Roseobacter cerasinus]